VSPLRGIWECWGVENTRIDFPTPIGLVRKDAENYSVQTTMSGFREYTIWRGNGALPVEVAGRFTKRQRAVCGAL
jgi:hypothetical protein